MVKGANILGLVAALTPSVFANLLHQKHHKHHNKNSGNSKKCADELLFVNFGDRPDGTRSKPGDIVTPMMEFQGGARFEVYNKAHMDQKFDDGILIEHGKTNLQLGASIDISKAIEKPARDGAIIVVYFPQPVIVHSVLVLDPDDDPKAYRDLIHFGHVELHGVNERLRKFELPPNQRTDMEVNNPGRMKLKKQVADYINLFDTPGVTKIIIDTGEGGWKTIDRLQFTVPCNTEKEEDELTQLIGSTKGRDKGSNGNDRDNPNGPKGAPRAMQFPACVGKTVEECKMIVETEAPDCEGNILAAVPRKFQFYRIWISVDDDGKIIGRPRRG